MSPPPAPRKPSRPGDPEAFGAQLDALLKGLEAEEPGILRRGKTYHAQQQAKAGAAAMQPASPADTPPVEASAESAGQADPPTGSSASETTPEAPEPPGGESQSPADALVDRQIEQQIEQRAADALAEPADPDAEPTKSQGPAPGPDLPAEESKASAPELSDPGADTPAAPPAEAPPEETFEHQLEDLLAQIKPDPAPGEGPDAATPTDRTDSGPAAPGETTEAAPDPEQASDDDLAALSSQLQNLMAQSEAAAPEPTSADDAPAPEATAAPVSETTAEADEAEPAASEPAAQGGPVEAEVGIEELDDLLAGEPIEGEFESIEDLAAATDPATEPTPQGASGADVAAELDTQPEVAAATDPVSPHAKPREPDEAGSARKRAARRALAAMVHYGERGAYHGCRLINSPLTRLSAPQRATVGWIGLLTLFNGTLIVAFALLT